MNIFKKFNQNHYQSRIEQFLYNLNIDYITNIIDDNITKISNAQNNSETENSIKILRRENKGNNIEYAIYFDSVRVSILKKENGVILKVCLLGEDSEWDIKNNENTDDILSKTTESYNIYTYCNILMPTSRFMDDSVYISGSWNKYVYDTLETIWNYINSYHEKNKYDKLYEKKLKNEDKNY